MCALRNKKKRRILNFKFMKPKNEKGEKIDGIPLRLLNARSNKRESYRVKMGRKQLFYCLRPINRRRYLIVPVSPYRG